MNQPKNNTQETTIKICTEVMYDILTQQSFGCWYERDFKDYMTGEEDAPTKEQITAELQRAVSNKILN
jgi:hypothetical protein